MKQGIDNQPVGKVKWVDRNELNANDYNPNFVAPPELELLKTSIMEDGWTQPIVILSDNTIVDGFHRWTLSADKEVSQMTDGKVPVAVVDFDKDHRMMSTIRHNRARGKHNINGMANMVFSMLDEGWNDAQICNEIGLEKEELIRLKYITGFAKLFEGTEYKKSWKNRLQLKQEKEYWDAQKK